jgi:probable F420-dependent oxidoreductase
VKFGIHLPQSGPAASADAISGGAKHAEDLGFSDVWVSDHIVLPRGAPYPPSSYILEPLVALTWAAAATERVGLGTTVLVLPLRPPVLLAKMLGSLDIMSGGRVIVGAASGWLKEEFDALGVPFEERGVRTDETIDLMRQCWENDPIDTVATATGAKLVAMRAKPQPDRRISIWIGGHSEAAFRRAIRVGDGWHGAFQSPDKTAEMTARLRSERPDPDSLFRCERPGMHCGTMRATSRASSINSWKPESNISWRSRSSAIVIHGSAVARRSRRSSSR